MRSDTAITPIVTRWLNRDLRLRLGGGFSYLFHRPQPLSQVGTDVFIVDAQASLRLREVEFGIQIENLLNSEYHDSEFTYPSTFGSDRATLLPRRHVTVGDPTTVMATLSYYFDTENVDRQPEFRP